MMWSTQVVLFMTPVWDHGCGTILASLKDYQEQHSCGLTLTLITGSAGVSVAYRLVSASSAVRRGAVVTIRNAADVADSDAREPGWQGRFCSPSTPLYSPVSCLSAALHVCGERRGIPTALEPLAWLVIHAKTWSRSTMHVLVLIDDILIRVSCLFS